MSAGDRSGTSAPGSTGSGVHASRFTATLRGVTVAFDTEDAYSQWWFYPRYADGRIHERAVTETLVEALAEAKCFVDVGAHLGWYTCIAARLMPDGVVYGFEMDHLNFALLRRNLALNACGNAEAFHAAVADAPGVVRYRRPAGGPSPNFQMQVPAGPDEHDAAGTVAVESVTLDDFMARKGRVPDVVKIDVEGAELSVLRGMRRLLGADRPVLFVEVHPKKLGAFGASPTAVLSLLEENGYRVFEIQSMRGHGDRTQLSPLEPDAKLEKTTMLHCIPIAGGTRR